MKKVSFTVLGEPEGKGRPKFRRQGQYVKTYTPEQTISYENLIKTEYRRQCGDVFFGQGVPLEIIITAYYSVPKSVSKKKRQAMLDRVIRPCKKPDADNVVKCFMDAGNKVIFYDDVQVVDLVVRKYYDERPRVVVTVREV